jgi:hypothetical protein
MNSMNDLLRGTRLACLAAGLLAALPVPALAGESMPAEPAGAVPAPGAQTSARGALLGSPVLARSSLATQRGGTAVGSEMQLSAALTNNRATDVSTGSNRVAHGAFSGASGLPVVIQNSGNNVLIQNATIVNLQLR